MRLNKTELPKKRIVVFMVEYSFSEPALQKNKEDFHLPSFKVLSDNNALNYINLKDL